MELQEKKLLCAELCKFLGENSWLFDFSNVRVLDEVAKWPRNWADFIKNTSVIDLKTILTSSEKVVGGVGPNFVHNFVQRRNGIVRDLEAAFISKTASETASKTTITNSLKKGHKTAVPFLSKFQMKNDRKSKLFQN
jgi:hypothetical protein